MRGVCAFNGTGEMKPHSEIKEPNSTKRDLKRYRWVCHKSATGLHTFELMVPDYLIILSSRKVTVEEYYARESSGTWPISLCWWKCSACGRKEMDSEKEPDKRIRNNIK